MHLESFSYILTSLENVATEAHKTSFSIEPLILILFYTRDFRFPIGGYIY